MSKAPTRLMPLRKFRVRDTAKADENPCITAMSSVLACWASVGYNTAGCAAVENALRLCMDTTVKKEKRPDTINYHLARFHKRMSGPTKHQGSKD